MHDAESYQQLLNAKDRMEAIEEIKRGLQSMNKTEAKPAAEFFLEFCTLYDVGCHDGIVYLVMAGTFQGGQ